MMYLTKLFLDPIAIRMEKVRDDYSIHRVVYSMFPNDGLKKRILYADCGPVTGGRKLLVLSPVEPIVPDHISSATALISDSFFTFSDYRFQISMNPVKRDSATGKRIAVTGQLDLLNWFIAHSSKWGFEADTRTLEVFSRPTRCFPKNNGEALFNHVDFYGRLHITDKELFMKSFFAGLGHGKAFGFGLLQLRPITINS